MIARNERIPDRYLFIFCMHENSRNSLRAFCDFAGDSGRAQKPNKTILRQRYLTKVVWKSAKLHAILTNSHRSRERWSSRPVRKLRALSKESSLLKFSSRIRARARCRISMTAAVRYRHALTQSFFDSGFLDSQPFITSEGFCYASIKRAPRRKILRRARR